MSVYIILAVIVVIILWFIGGYNSFIKLKNRVEEGFATMDVYLKKRFDIIPNLVGAVKGYASHEKETLAAVIEARNKAGSSSKIDDRVISENQITGALGKLFALAENYPNLKADSQFLDLQRQLETVETDIAQSRKYYNAVVKEFNTKCEMFPASIIAKIFSFPQPSPPKTHLIRR